MAGEVAAWPLARLDPCARDPVAAEAFGESAQPAAVVRLVRIGDERRFHFVTRQVSLMFCPLASQATSPVNHVLKSASHSS